MVERNIPAPFSSKTFLTSVPYLDVKNPIKVSPDWLEIETVTYLCRNDDYKTDRIALALFLV